MFFKHPIASKNKDPGLDRALGPYFYETIFFTTFSILAVRIYFVRSGRRDTPSIMGIFKT